MARSYTCPLVWRNDWLIYMPTDMPTGMAKWPAHIHAYWCGVIAFRRSGLLSVTVATASCQGAARSRQARQRKERGRCSALGLTPGGAAAAAQRHTGLGQDPVHEAVGPAGRAGQ